MAPATLIQAQRSAGGQPHRATSIERPRRYAKIVNLHDHDLRAGGKVAVCFNRCELIELSRITACTDRAVPNRACGAVDRAEVRHARSFTINFTITATSYLCSALAEINSSGKILSLSWGGLRQSVLFAARCVRSHSQIGLKPQIPAKHLSARHSSCHPRQRPEIQ